MKRAYIKRFLMIFLASLVLLGSLLIPGFAADGIKTENTCTLTVYFGQDGAGISGASFRLYQVANVSEDANFTLTGSFAQYPVNLNGLDSSGWRDLAQTLVGYVSRDGLTPLQTDQTDAHGDAVFSGLTTGLYLVVGATYDCGDQYYVPEPFLVSLPNLDEQHNTWVYDVTANCKFDVEEYEPEPTSCQVIKIWKDEGYEAHRPERIQVQLLKDGQVYDTVYLSEENGWQYTWVDLDSSVQWQVVEESVPEAYTVSVNREGILYTITNAYREPEPSPSPSISPTPSPQPSPTPTPGRIPQTGMLWWPVPLLALAGMLLFVIGWLRHRHGS